jgi:uncharacterized RDD family membrane protein YckC
MQASPEEKSPDPSSESVSVAESEMAIIKTAEDSRPDAPDADQPPPTSTLIEFPGVNRRVEPAWRKELSRRVREVQERRAREAAEAPAVIVAPKPPPPDPVMTQLELVPQLPTPAMNRLVENALRRVERARKIDPVNLPRTFPNSANRSYQAYGAAAAAAKIETETMTPQENNAVTAAEVIQSEPIESNQKTPNKPGLVVVSPNSKVEQKIDPKPLTPAIEEVALSYLDNYAASPVSYEQSNRAGFGRRIFSGVLDLFFIAFLSAPFAAGIEFADGNWRDPRIRGLMIGAALLVMLLYLTLSTALRGQTWGMRSASIRAIDVRTGLIPTGSQSIIRGFACLLSLATLGLGVAYALIDRDRRTLSDRFSRTVVVID